MKKNVTLLLIVISLTAVQACQEGDFRLLSSEEVPEDKVEMAKAFSENYFSNLRNGKVNTFSNETTEALKEALTPDKQMVVYERVKDDVGEFESLEYTETWVHKNNPDSHIIRFKGSFDKSDKKAEIRVVVNSQNKISGFWIKPWVDPLS